MAKNTPNTERRQQTSNTNTQTKQQASPGTTANSAAASNRSDRERSIETQRDTRGAREHNSASTGLTRGPTFGPIYSTHPLSLMRRMSEDMDRLFQEFGFGRTGLGLSPFAASSAATDRWSPQVETFRRGDQYVVRADLPGMNKDDVNVEIQGDMLSISGERCDEHEDNDDGYYRTERSYGQFYRSIPLPDGVNTEQCDASFKDGVLEITFKAPKTEQDKARKVQIR